MDAGCWLSARVLCINKVSSGHHSENSKKNMWIYIESKYVPYTGNITPVLQQGNRERLISEQKQNTETVNTV